MRLLLAFAAVTVVMAPPFASRAAMDADAFLDSEAARAFQAGRYDAALEGFHALLARHPDDPTVLRYVGITWYELGRYDEAVEALHRASERWPDDAAIRFHLGRALVRAGERERAVETFRRVVAAAGDTVYERHARRYLAGLGQRAARNEPPREHRRWHLSAQLAGAYDDNVPAAPEGSGRERTGFRVVESAAGSLDLVDRGPWRVRASAGTDHSQHLEDSLDDFDLARFEGGLEAARAFDLAGIPVSLDLEYDFDSVLLSGDFFSRSHAVTASGTLVWSRWTATRIHHRVRFDEFEDEGARSSLTSRDGFTNAVGLRQYLFTPERRHFLSVGYEFRKGDAQGENFDLRAHEAAVQASVSLPWSLRLDGAFAFAHVDHPDFVGPVERETDRVRATAALTRPVVQGVTLGVSYDWVDADSTIGALDHDRRIATVSIGVEL